MSLTDRDEPGLKTPHPNITDTEPTDREGADEMNDDPACAASDVMATLCRMSLVRSESLSVNGAYARSPPTLS